MKKKLYTILTAVLLVCSMSTASADTINLIVPKAPGGGADIVARIVSEKMAPIGNNIIVLNKPGADGAIGANIVATSVPNGKTLFFGSISDTVMLPLFKVPNLKFDENTFIPIAYIGSQPAVLTASLNFPANNFKEFLNVIKDKSKIYPIGSFSKTSDLHANILFGLAGATPELVSYKGDAPMIMDLATNNLSLGMTGLAGSREFAKTKKIKYIAIFSKNRLKDFPEVGTVAEYNGWTGGFWYGIFAPPGTPSDVVKELHQSFNTAINDPVVKEKLENNGLTVKTKTQEEFVKFYQNEFDTFKPIVNSIPKVEKY